MECVFLGTGYSIITERRHNTSLFLRKGNAAVMIDGNGAAVRRLTSYGYAFEELEHIFLTHEHVDHVGAMGNIINQIWLKSCYYRQDNVRTKPLHIHANARTVTVVQNLLAALQVPQSPQLFPLEYHVLPYEGGELNIDGIAITYFPVDHSAPCFGIAVRGEKRGLVYSADTQPLPSIYAHLQENDVLIHECNSVDDAVNAGHTTWQQFKELMPTFPHVESYLVHLPPMDEARETTLKADMKSMQNGTVAMAEDGQVLAL